jgi:hypothetical protein
MALRSLLDSAAELGAVGIALLGSLGIVCGGIGIERALAADPTRPPATMSQTVVSPSTPSPADLRDAVSSAMRRANQAKGNDRAQAVKSLLNVYQELGRDILLPAKERLRLGVQMRVRLQRFAGQFRYETAHTNSARASDARNDVVLANRGQTGAAAGPAVEGLDSLVELIQTTIGRPDDWVAVAAQQGLGQPGGNGPALGGAGGGFGGAGAARGGGAFGNNDALEKGAEANGADLVDLIQKTVDPPSWDVNGGPGSIMYFNNLRVLVVRQTGDGQDDVGGLLGGLRKH